MTVVLCIRCSDSVGGVHRDGVDEVAGRVVERLARRPCSGVLPYTYYLVDNCNLLLNLCVYSSCGCQGTALTDEK